MAKRFSDKIEYFSGYEKWDNGDGRKRVWTEDPAIKDRFLKKGAELVGTDKYHNSKKVDAWYLLTKR